LRDTEASGLKAVLPLFLSRCEMQSELRRLVGSFIVGVDCRGTQTTGSEKIRAGSIKAYVAF